MLLPLLSQLGLKGVELELELAAITARTSGVPVLVTTIEEKALQLEFGIEQTLRLGNGAQCAPLLFVYTSSQSPTVLGLDTKPQKLRQD